MSAAENEVAFLFFFLSFCTELSTVHAGFVSLSVAFHFQAAGKSKATLVQAKIESSLIIEEVTPESCRQTLEGSVEIKIVGLGHVVEKIVVDNLKNVYKGVPHIVER